LGDDAEQSRHRIGGALGERENGADAIYFAFGGAKLDPASKPLLATRLFNSAILRLTGRASRSWSGAAIRSSPPEVQLVLAINFFSDSLLMN